MKGSRYAAALVLALGSAVLARAAGMAPPTIDPPPGWNDVTGAKPPRGVLVALRGPEKSSFMIARMPAAAGTTAAATRAYLLHALAQLSAATGAAYQSDGRVQAKTFRSGLTAHYIRAEAPDRPILLVAALDAGGLPVLATLSSAAPEAMMEPLFGAVRMGAPAGAVHESGTAVSLDGQLQLALGGGLRSRDLEPREKQKGAVLAVQGAGSEVVFVKVEKDEASPKDQAAIARATAADASKTPLEKVSPARKAPTAAGPAAVYAWARIQDSPDSRFAAGYLPWSYWGYTLFARGPQADELLSGTLAAIQRGPRAVGKLVDATPQLLIPQTGPSRVLLGAVAGVCGVLAVALLLWSRGRKNATFGA